MNAKIPRMDYRQYRAARRLVHECCNYDGGNCLLLEDGEPCVCVQSISYSLLCRWFTAAVLPLDEALEAALLRRTHEADKRHQTEAETKGEMSRFRAFQTRINQGFFRGCQRVRDTFYPFPLKTPSKSVTEPIDRHHKEVNPIADYMTAGTVVVKHFCNTLFENSPGISSFKWCFPIIVGMRTDMIVPYVHISV